LSRGGTKRRLRIRRKRKGENSAADTAADLAHAAGPEVVAEFGCCLVEAVGGVSILIGLLFVPYYFLVA
jgi:hypothetical protein